MIKLPFEILNPAEWAGETGIKYKTVKYDGYRLQLYKTKKKVYACTRTQEIQDKLADVEWFDNAETDMEEDTVVEGELLAPGKNATEVPHYLKHSPNKLVFRAFAVPWFQGKEQFNLSLQDAKKLCTSMFFNFSQYFKYNGETEDELKQEALDKKIEGFVLKEANYCGWYKVKPTHTLDLIVTGMEYSTAKSHPGAVRNLKGSVYINNTLTEVVSCGGGISKEMRLGLSKSDIGRVFEVEYQTMGSKGRLIMARFIRWRDDKPAKECIYV